MQAKSEERLLHLTPAENITVCPGNPICFDDRWAPCPFCVKLTSDMTEAEALAAFDLACKGH